MEVTRCGVYLHIPYCSRKCDYCAFHSITRWSDRAETLLIDKIIADAALFRVEAKTLYIGGGTPSVLARGQLSRLIAGVSAPLGTPAEITCEANPESAGEAFLEEAIAAGVTRLSIGVQSLSANLAAEIGRLPATVATLASIRRAWKRALSADLIIGIPGQTTSDVISDIRTLYEIGFGHLSIYDLSIEPGTPLSRKVSLGTIEIPEFQPEWQTVCHTFEELGFTRYEVSSFALPGEESHHNLGYWRAEPYLGLGPSATSTLPSGGEVVRFNQPTDHARYLRESPYQEPERLDHAARLVEFLMLGMRTREGVSYRQLNSISGLNLEDRLSTAIGSLSARGMLTSDGERLRPTSLGMDFLNPVLTELLAGLEI